MQQSNKYLLIQALCTYHTICADDWYEYIVHL